MHTRKAEWTDLDRMLEIESSAIPGYGYLEENKDFYFAGEDKDGNRNKGEMILALNEEEVPVGMGQYSILPDGSGWLEILRVKKEYQGQGAGKAIYRRYLELMEETKAPSAAMFTGWKNAASRGLAEKNGFSLAAVHEGFDYIIHDEKRNDSFSAFRLVEEETAAVALMEEAVRQTEEKGEGFGPFMALNRTFFHFGIPLYRYLCQNKMIYTDGTNLVVIGARMLRGRGLHLGFFAGDTKTCLSFAIAKTAEEGKPKLTLSFPPSCGSRREEVLKAGFVSTGEVIVMERICR